MDEKASFDFWYAVNNTEVLIRPRNQLETFGTTTVHYHLVAEMMDTVHQVRVREGKIHAYRPQIITPDTLNHTLLEGFSEDQAGDYLDWLRQNQENLLLLKYGFSVRKESINEHIVTDNVENVVERIRPDVESSPHPMHALIRGVDEPWEVCLLRLLVDVVQQSVMTNAQDLRADPRGIKHRFDRMFLEASKDPSLIPALSNALEQSGVFKEFEDRFFALVRASRRGMP